MPQVVPANHFGFLKSGTMKVHYDDGTNATVNAGESYLILPGHLPEVVGDVPWYVRKINNIDAEIFLFFSASRSSLSRRNSAR